MFIFILWLVCNELCLVLCCYCPSVLFSIGFQIIPLCNLVLAKESFPTSPHLAKTRRIALSLYKCRCFVIEKVTQKVRNTKERTVVIYTDPKTNLFLHLISFSLLSMQVFSLLLTAYFPLIYLVFILIYLCPRAWASGLRKWHLFMIFFCCQKINTITQKFHFT